MQALLQGVEIQPAGTGDDYFAIDDATLGQRLRKRPLEFREVTVQRLEIAALDVNLVTVSKDDGAKAVPFGFEDKALLSRKLIRYVASMGSMGGVVAGGAAMPSCNSSPDGPA